MGIIHIYNNSKDYLPPKYRQDFIKQSINTDVSGIYPKVNYMLFWEESTANNKNQINDICKKAGASVLFMGFYGLKGSKKDPNVLSSGVAFLSLYCSCTLVIMKQPITRATEPKYSWLVCYDGSSKCVQAIEFLKKYANPSKDKFELVVVKSPAFKPALPKVEGFKVTVLEIGLQSNLEVSAALVKYCTSLDDTLNFVLFGNKGSDAMNHKGDYIGSVARELILKVPENIILL